MRKLQHDISSSLFSSSSLDDGDDGGKSVAGVASPEKQEGTKHNNKLPQVRSLIVIWIDRTPEQKMFKETQ